MDGPKPEAGRAENGVGQRAPSPPARGLGERCNLSQFEILVELETSKFTTEMPYN